jgi:hypothetical protein
MSIACVVNGARFGGYKHAMSSTTISRLLVMVVIGTVFVVDDDDAVETSGSNHSC